MPKTLFHPQSIVMGGSVLVAACNSHYVLRYKTRSNQWSVLPSCPVEGFGLGHLSGKLVTVGGVDGSGATVNDVYTYGHGETQGDVGDVGKQGDRGRRRETQGDVGRHRETWGGTGSRGETQGDMGRHRRHGETQETWGFELLLSNSSSRVWLVLEHGPALMSLIESNWKCFQS